MVRRNASILPEKANRISGIGINIGDIIIEGRGRYFWRRRQYRGPAGKRFVSQAAYVFQGPQMTKSGTSFRWLSLTSARASREEHLARGRRVRAYGKGY